MMEVTIASNNAGKIREYRDILTPLGFDVRSQREKNVCLEVEETGDTFEENAALKARAVYEKTRSWVLSDDSGLEVEALNGAPGIYSARYLGKPTEHERRLAVLEGLRDEANRRARFHCCICLIDPDGEEHLFTGLWPGRIAEREEGTNGFGYDPIFIADDAGGRTTASLPIAFKESHSHRARAVRQLMDYLNEKIVSET